MIKSYPILVILTIITAFFPFTSCSNHNDSPYIKAEVTDSAENKNIVNNFKLLYWWEERGETPYLKPYKLYSKELIVEIETPVDNNSKRISLSTERFSLQELERILIRNTATGYEISIETKTGEKILATDNFPKSIKKGKGTGLADHLLYAYGKVMVDSKEKKFKKSLNILKEIRIVDVK